MTIDNHTNLDDRLFIDYQYQSINWHRLSSIVIDCHRSSISSIGYALQWVTFQRLPQNSRDSRSGPRPTRFNFTQWIHIAEWIAPFEKRIADCSVQKARSEVVRCEEKIQFDGLYLTRGHYSSGATFHD